MTDVFIGRRPVLDQNLDVWAHELVYRYDASLTPAEGAKALVTRVVDHGFREVAGEVPVILKVSRSMLLDSTLDPLPHEQLVLDVLADEGIDEAMLDALEERRANRATILIPDYVEDERFRPLASIASVVKIDVSSREMDGVRARLLTLRQKADKLLAVNVETRGAQERYAKVGFDLFQGLFLTQPDVLEGSIPSSKIATLQLLAVLEQPDPDIDEIEAAVEQNVSVSYQVLRYVNSAFVGLRQRVESIRQAIVLLGPPTIRHIASVAFVADMEDAPREVMRAALVRAKMCEGIARSQREAPGTFYTAGLFSALDALTAMPLEQLVEDLPLTEDVVAAILHQTGPIGQAVEVAKAYERFDWSDPAFQAFDPVMLSEVYLEALAWADRALAGGDLSDRPTGRGRATV